MNTATARLIVESVDLSDRKWLLNPVGPPTGWLVNMGLACEDGRVTTLGEEVTQILSEETAK